MTAQGCREMNITVESLLEIIANDEALVAQGYPYIVAGIDKDARHDAFRRLEGKAFLPLTDHLVRGLVVEAEAILGGDKTGAARLKHHRTVRAEPLLLALQSLRQGSHLSRLGVNADGPLAEHPEYAFVDEIREVWLDTRRICFLQFQRPAIVAEHLPAYGTPEVTIRADEAIVDIAAGGIEIRNHRRASTRRVVQRC